MTESKDALPKRCPACGMSWVLFPPANHDDLVLNPDGKTHYAPTNGYRCVECKQTYRILTHPEAQGNKDLGEPAASGLEEEAQLAAVKFANLILDAYWPDCNDIDGSDIQALGIKSGVMQEVPGGYDPEKHGESIYDAEPGDTWYVAHPSLELLLQAQRAAQAAPTSPQPIKGESELESASNGMGLR